MTFAPMEIEILREGDVVRVKIRGEVDLATAPAVDDQVQNAVQAGFDELILDADEITFLDSSGLRVLLQIRDVAEKHGSQFRIERPSLAVRRTLAVTQLAELFGLEE